MRVHRGLADDTLARYRSLVMELLETLGNDPRQFDARRIRAFVIAQARRGPGRVKDVGLATRAFLRHLSTLGRCPTSLLDAVPAMAVWRLARLPKYLSAADVARVIASCRPATTAGSRDRAVLLLLARLALRAGDIVAMRTRDIDWREGTITVMGKSQRQSRLPLPQDAGDAILAYLRKRPKVPTDRLFLRVHAPWRPLSKRGTVSAIVRGAIRRAGVDAPCNRYAVGPWEKLDFYAAGGAPIVPTVGQSGGAFFANATWGPAVSNVVNATSLTSPLRSTGGSGNAILFSLNFNFASMYFFSNQTGRSVHTLSDGTLRADDLPRGGPEEFAIFHY
jgi:site-specific recombinase XerC